MIDIESHFLFHKDDIIVIGCSAGPDSMSLVDLLLKVRNKYNLSLIIAHVNHNVRKESFIECDFLKKYCIDNNLIFESMIIDNYGDDNFHNEARNIRYHFFEKIVHKYHANYLMTAHHGDDLIETILMRIVRGSNLNGYSGFHELLNMGDYILARPLLHYTKQQLEEYDILNKVPYFIDQSNLKDTYTRNRYRKYILPFLKEEEPNVHEKFLKFSKVLYDTNLYIEKKCNDALNRVIIDDSIIISKFLEEDDFIKREILYSLLSNFYQDDLILISDKHVDLIFNLIYSRKKNSFINLPNDVIVRKTYDYLTITRNVDALSSYEIELDKNVQLPNNHSIDLIDDIHDNSNNICRLDSKDVVLPLIVRSRRIGDKIAVKGLNGSKKVKDIFIDKKISLIDRDLWPVVVDSAGTVVWIPGLKKSKFDKKINDYYDIILKYS